MTCKYFFHTAHDAKMGLTETRLAIIPGGGGLIRVPCTLYNGMTHFAHLVSLRTKHYKRRSGGHVCSGTWSEFTATTLLADFGYSQSHIPQLGSKREIAD